jgi:hypothetical protein
MGDEEGAREVWKEGLQRIQKKLNADPDHGMLRLLRLEYQGLLGYRDAFLANQPVALERTSMRLIGAYVKLDLQQMIIDSLALPRPDAIPRDSFLGSLKLFHNSLKYWGADEVLESPVYRTYREQEEAELSRLREKYMPVER